MVSITGNNYKFKNNTTLKNLKKCTKKHDARADLLIKPIVLRCSRYFFDHISILFNI